jgi:hypothetical protein
VLAAPTNESAIQFFEGFGGVTAGKRVNSDPNAARATLKPVLELNQGACTPNFARKHLPKRGCHCSKKSETIWSNLAIGLTFQNNTLSTSALHANVSGTITKSNEFGLQQRAGDACDWNAV